MYNCRFQGPLTDHFPGQRLSKICDGTVEAETKLFLTVPPPLVKLPNFCEIVKRMWHCTYYLGTTVTLSYNSASNQLVHNVLQ